MERMLFGWCRDNPERVLSLDTPGSVKVCDNNRNLGCAWKAGCGETRTSGLGRGVRRPASARWRGASLLLYSPEPVAPGFRQDDGGLRGPPRVVRDHHPAGDYSDLDATLRAQRFVLG